MLTNSFRSFVVFAAVAVAAPSTAFALRMMTPGSSTPPANGVISACVNREGEVRVINPNYGGRCRSSESPMSWNQVGAPGPQGPAGLQGANGTPGPAGPAGSAGPAGPLGPAGPAGPAGSAGPAGPTGPQGPKGNVGMEGPQGPAGPMGHDGLPGAPGATGPQGPQGPAGAAGAQGATGPQGLAGADGAKGATGPQGATGAQGATGPQGVAGATGSQGPAGADGAVGPQGPTGPAGVAGPTGPQGLVGPTGPQGPAGMPQILSPVGTPSSVGGGKWNSNSNNVWLPVPELQLTWVMANAGPVAISFNLSVPMNGSIVTHLKLDNAVVPSTNVVVGNTAYATNVGTYYAVLPKGPHTVQLEYRTNGASFMFDPAVDYEASRLQVMSFDQ